MAEHDTSTGLTFSGCLVALPADGFLFVAFELSLTARQAVLLQESVANVRETCGLPAGRQLTTRYETSFDSRITSRKALYLVTGAVLGSATPTCILTPRRVRP